MVTRQSRPAGQSGAWSAPSQAKRMVNSTLDIMGQYNALQTAFDIHTTGHGNALSVSGQPILVDLEAMKKAQR